MGAADTGSDGRAVAVLYENGDIVQLDTLLDPAEGWRMTTATAINDVGQIAGTACRLGARYAVRLDLAPVPGPGQVLLLAGGIMLLLARGARRRAKPNQQQRSRWRASAAAMA